MIGLRGKRALVTGGSRGIGAATSRLLAEHGVHVAIGYRSRRDDAERLAASLCQAHDVRAIAHAADISTLRGAEDLVERAARGAARRGPGVRGATTTFKESLRSYQLRARSSALPLSYASRGGGGDRTHVRWTSCPRPTKDARARLA